MPKPASDKKPLMQPFPSSISPPPKKVSFLKHNEAIRLEAWQDGNNKQNEVTDPAVILQNQREGDGSAGPEKKGEIWS